jgi:hypothetical protein
MDALRTVTQIEVIPNSLRVAGGKVDQGARELVEALLVEERLLWPEEPALTREDVIATFNDLERSHGDARTPFPTDPSSREIVNAVRKQMGLPPATGRGARLVASEAVLRMDRSQSLLFDGLCQAVSILAQIPAPRRRDALSSLELVFFAPNENVVGLVFRTGTAFTFRLRHSDPGTLKAATQRLAHALAPRGAADVDRLLEAVHPEVLTGVESKLDIVFRDKIEMRTPADELAQIGEVHPVSSQWRLAWYVATTRPQSLLLYLSLLLIALDLVYEITVGPLQVGETDLTAWLGGVVERIITAMLGAYLVASFLRLADLRTQLRASYDRGRGFFGRRKRGGFGAFIEWRAAAPPRIEAAG